MCVIVYSPDGKAIPEDVFHKCWATNDDGAGLMFSTGQKIVIRKGYGNEKKFWKAVKKLDVPYVLHFRIGTSGGNQNLQMTHPWKIADTLGMAHNGVISGLGCPQKSDTARLAHAMSLLAPESFKLDGVVKIIDYLLQGSRLILMFADGKVEMLGDGWSEDGGLFFSNTNWKSPKHSYSSSYSSYYGDSWYPTSYTPKPKDTPAAPAKEERCPECDQANLLEWGADEFCEVCGFHRPKYRSHYVY